MKIRTIQIPKLEEEYEDWASQFQVQEPDLVEFLSLSFHSIHCLDQLEKELQVLESCCFALLFEIERWKKVRLVQMGCYDIDSKRVIQVCKDQFESYPFLLRYLKLGYWDRY